MTVHHFDPRPPHPKPAPESPFYLGLAWALAGTAVFWIGVGVMVHTCTRAVFGAGR